MCVNTVCGNSLKRRQPEKNEMILLLCEDDRGRQRNSTHERMFRGIRKCKLPGLITWTAASEPANKVRCTLAHLHMQLAQIDVHADMFCGVVFWLQRNSMAGIDTTCQHRARTCAPILTGALCQRFKAVVKSSAVHVKSARVDSMIAHR